MYEYEKSFITLGPDRTFTDTLLNISGLLEIKCHHVLKNCDPYNFSDHLTPAQCKNFCCVVNNKGKLKLKRNHKYYYQVQMQLALCELDIADFIVWSPKGMSVERIAEDKTLWSMVIHVSST